MKKLIFKDKDDLNKYLVNKYPGVNHNLMMCELILNSRGTSLKKISKDLEIPGNPFLRIAER